MSEIRLQCPECGDVFDPEEEAECPVCGCASGMTEVTEDEDDDHDDEGEDRG